MEETETDNMCELLQFLLDCENLFDDWSSCKVSNEYVVNRFKLHKNLEDE